MTRCVCGIIVASFVAVSAVGEDAFPHQVPLAERKIIKLYGWERPDTKGFREHIEEIQRAGFDGVGINVMPDEKIPDKDWGKSGNYLWISSHAFKREDFSNAVADLKATDMGGVTENFIHVAMRGTRMVDFSGEGWSTAVDNARVLSWVAKEGGLAGVTLDVEDAGPLYYRGTRRAKFTFEEYGALARQGGREWMAALCEDCPEMTVILTMGHWFALHYMQRYGLAELEDVEEYTFLPAFIDGMLEGASEGATIVDGCELTYPFMHYKTFEDFRRRTTAEDLSLTAVPELYRKTMRKALSVWTGFPKDYGSAALSAAPQKNHFSPSRFEHAIANALALSDKYVWVWSGANVWWPVTMPCYDGKKTFPMSQDYIMALAKARKPHSKTWSPRAPDRKEYGNVAPGIEEDLAGLMATHEKLMTLPEEWWFRLDPDAIIEEHMDEFDGWLSPEYVGLDEELCGWRKISTASHWEAQEIPYDGAAWYRVRFNPPDEAAGRRVWACFTKVLGKVKAYGACEGRGPAVEIRTTREGDRVMLPLTGMTRADKWTFIAMRVYSPEGPGGIAGPVVLVGRKGETASAITERRVLVDLDLTKTTRERVADQSGLGNDGTIHGATTTENGLSFDGENDYVDCGNDTSLIPASDEISWEVDICPVAQQEQGIRFHIIAGKHPMYTNGLYFDYGVKPNQILFFQGSASGPRYHITDYAKFHHVVATFGGETMTLYVDGALVESRRSLIPPVANDAPLFIGGGEVDVFRGSACTIRRVRVYNYCLEEGEVAALYKKHTGEIEQP